MVAETGNALPERQIEAGGRTYVTVEDLVLRDRLVVAGRVIERITGDPWRGGFAVRLTSGDVLRSRARSDGFFAVAGDPERAFPDLAVNPAAIGLAVSAAGFRPREVTVAVPVASSFPLPAIEVALDRLPITILGRAVEVASRNPIAGARVAFTSPTLALLRTPLHFGHAAGAPVRACQLNLAGAAKTLAAPAVRGASTLLLSNRTGLGVGDLLRLGPDGRREVVVIRSLAPMPANPALPGEVTLTAPLVRSFGVNEAAQPVTAADLPGLSTLSAEVFSGGGVLPLSAALTVSTVRVEAAASPAAEYHVLGALTDADGYYRAAGVDRPARTDLTATALGFDPLVVPWVASFAHPVNRVDFAMETP
ncbi:MAG TPA: hypothetical protein VLT87_27625 [Thermoanaerobaculia bacterium]|nr:hypothetical protein [Thermoanaerobaculia bacterium]